jgi:metal-sulfur cluster biosynthetic enzyme
MRSDKVWKILSQVIDPELAINIVDLGLIYEADLVGDTVKIVMTLTTPACPFADIITEQIENMLGAKGYETTIRITFDPPWSKDKIAERILIERGLV